MDGREFYDAVAAHPGLEWLGVRGDEVCVRATRAGGPMCALTPSAIRSEIWADVAPVLLGARRARTLLHQTRIVGYFSGTHLWNRSKLTELADRRRAPHAVGGAWGEDGVPDEVVAALVAGGAEAVCDARRPT